MTRKRFHKLVRAMLTEFYTDAKGIIGDPHYRIYNKWLNSEIRVLTSIKIHNNDDTWGNESYKEIFEHLKRIYS